jgi:hypothetical protein
VADMIRVRTTISGLTGLPGLMTAYFVGSSTATSAEATEAVARVRAMMEAIKTRLNTAVTYTYPSSVDLLDPDTGTLTGSLGVSAPAPSTGGSAAQPVPLATQLLLQLHTSNIIHGRRVRGRINVAGPNVGDVSGGAPAAALLTAGATAAANLGTTISTPIANVVWHRPNPAGAGAAVAVVSYSASNKFAVIRSRRD